MAAHREHAAYVLLPVSGMMIRRCAARLGRPRLPGAPEAPPVTRPAIGWDPIVVVPPVAALVAVLVMLLTVTIPIERTVPAPRGRVRDVGGWGASSAFTAARPGVPVRPAPRERMIVQPPASPTLRAEARSPLLVVPASTPPGLRSIQAP